MAHTYHNRRTTGIAFKLVMTIIPLITVGIAIIATVNYITTKAALLASAGQTLKEATDSNVNTIETFVESTLASLAHRFLSLR